MSWQDDPVVSESSPSGSWQDDPIVESPSKTESFVRGAANNFPLMPQAIAKGEAMTGLGDEGGYSKNMEDWNAKAAAAKTANPKTYGAGAVAGTLAPLAIPGVGTAMKAAPIAANAALGAANAVSNMDLSKSGTENIEEAGKGALVGGVFGKAGEVVGKGVGAIGRALKPAAERIESNATAGAIDLNSHAIRRLSPGNQNPETVMKTINEKVRRLFPDLVGYTDTAGSKLNKILVAHEQASDQIGKVVDDMTTKTGGALPEIDDAIVKLRQAASKYNGLTSAENLESKAQLNDNAATLEALQKEGKLDFRNLYEVKKGIGELFQKPNSVTSGTKQSFSIVSDTIDKILDRANIDNPAYKEAFKHMKEVFKFTSDLIPSMKPGVAREVAGVGGGILSAGLGTAAAMGHLMAVPAYVAKTATKLAAPDLGQNVAYKIVNAAKNSQGVQGKIGAGMNQALNNFLINEFKNKAAGRRDESSNR